VNYARDLTADGRAKPGSGVGSFCCELIRLGLPYQRIADLARERFGGKTSIHCVRWYEMRTESSQPDAPLWHRRTQRVRLDS
jgi:hypothetical protein